jgi:hypothetical protein
MWVVLDYVPQEGDGTKKPVATKTKMPPIQDPRMGKTDNLALPRRVDIMSADTYAPTVTRVMRPGADDHKICPSLRGEKRVPFSGNFIIDAA